MSWDKQPSAPRVCPVCGAAAPEGAADCRACGVVFAKWRAKQEALAAAPAAMPAAPSAAAADSARSPLRRLLGAALLAAGGWSAYRLRSPGVPGPAPDGARDAPGGAFAYAVPAGWKVASEDPSCRDAGCAALRLTPELPEDAPKDKVHPSLAVSFVPRPPAALRDAAFAGEAAAEIKAGYDAGDARAARGRVVDGLPAQAFEGAGTKRLRLETAPRVAMNAQAYLAEQERKDPKKGFYSVMAKVDLTRPNANPYVVVQEAQYADVDARLADRVVYVPLRGRLLKAAFRWDESDAAAGEAAADAFLSSLRVKDRSRPVDRLGGLAGALDAALLAVGGLALWLLML